MILYDELDPFDSPVAVWQFLSTTESVYAKRTSDSAVAVVPVDGGDIGCIFRGR